MEWPRETLVELSCCHAGQLFLVFCATVSLIQALEVATFAPFGRFISGRATVTRFRGLEVATLAPFGLFISGRATVTLFRALEVATLAVPLGGASRTSCLLVKLS